MSLGQTDSGIDPIIGETVKQAYMDRRLELPPADGFVADPSQNLSPSQAYMDQRLESLQDMDCLSLIQKDSGTGSIFIPHHSQKY